jgi:ribonuclease HI
MKLFLYCDGASRGNPGAAGAGAVLYDAHGGEVAGVYKFLGHATNNEAEYTGAIIGIEKAIALGARRVAIRADSQLMVRQLTGEYRVKAAHLRPLHQRVMVLLSKLEGWEAEHVPREKNARADALANEAIDRAGRP